MKYKKWGWRPAINPIQFLFFLLLLNSLATKANPKISATILLGFDYSSICLLETNDRKSLGDKKPQTLTKLVEP